MPKQGPTRYHDLMTSKAASFKTNKLAVNLVDLNCRGNQLTGFYMMGTLAIKRLIALIKKFLLHLPSESYCIRILVTSMKKLISDFHLKMKHKASFSL